MWRTAWKTSFQDSLIMQNLPGVGQDGKLYKTRFLKGSYQTPNTFLKALIGGIGKGHFR